MSRENEAYLKMISDIVFKFLEFREDYRSLKKQIQIKKTDFLNNDFSSLKIDDEYDSVPHYKFWEP